MPNLINRERHRFTETVNELNFHTFHARQFKPGGVILTYPVNGAAVRPSTHYSFIGDAVDRTATNQWFSGKFPSSPVFQLKADLSLVPLYTDFTDKDGNLVKFDVDGRPSLITQVNPTLYYLIGNPANLPEGFAFRIPSSLQSSLSEQAFNYFSDVFPTKLSLSEFIQGFTQLKQLLPELGESVTKTVSGGYLNKSFGWDNLLKDLDTIGNLCGIVMSRMMYLHKTYGIPTRLGFQRGNVYTGYNLANTVHLSGNEGFQVRDSIHSIVANYRATAWITQHLDFIHDLAGFVRVMIGALGLNNPVKAFWNTVPLSFVVDWFFNISQHLDNLTRINPAMGWDVTNVTHSLTYDVTFKLEQLRYGQVYPTSVIQTAFLPVRVYERFVGLSFPWELLNPAGLSTNQYTLLLAMLHQFG